MFLRSKFRPLAMAPLRTAAVALLSAVAACSPAIDPELQVGPDQPVRVRASLDREEATLGDRLAYTVEVAHLEGVEVRFPELPESLGGLRVVSTAEDQKPVRSGDTVLERRTYHLVADRVGPQVIAPQEIAFEGDESPAGSVATSEVAVEVASLLDAEEAEPTDIRDVKPLRRQQRSLALVLLGVAAALVAVATLLAWWWWRRRRKERTEEPALPPDEAALRALARLRQTDFTDPEALRAYYFALSETVRTYVEGRFGLNATDLTTEEITARLGNLSELASAEARRLRHLLDAADRVKFAREMPSKRQIEETFDSAVSFVEATRLVDEAASEGASSSGEPPSAVKRESGVEVKTAEEGA